MKKIFLLLALIVSINCFAQVDSTNIRISGIVLKGKDFKMLAFFCRLNSSRYPTLDSFVKAVTFPADGDDVSFTGIPNRQWWKMFQDFKNNESCLLSTNQNFKRLDDEIRLHGSVWLIWRLNNAIFDDDALNVNLRKAGADYAKKDDSNN